MDICDEHRTTCNQQRCYRALTRGLEWTRDVASYFHFDSFRPAPLKPVVELNRFAGVDEIKVGASGCERPKSPRTGRT